jgi:hypothetical protein
MCIMFARLAKRKPLEGWKRKKRGGILSALLVSVRFSGG